VVVRRGSFKLHAGALEYQQADDPERARHFVPVHGRDRWSFIDHSATKE
jgi:hypothetical protein